MSILSSSQKTIQTAAELLREGALVAFPTETVYGLGADATNGNAVAEIFALKGRPEFNPLIVHVSNVAMAKRYVQWNAQADILAEHFWPGPLTLVLPRLQDCAVSLLASAGGDTLGIRLSAHPVACAIIEAAGVPIAAPSANRSGRVSPTESQHVYAELGEGVKLIVDGGACAVGIESTVLDISGAQPVLLRPGAVTQYDLERVLHAAIAQSGQGGDDKVAGNACKPLCAFIAGSPQCHRSARGRSIAGIWRGCPARRQNDL